MDRIDRIKTNDKCKVQKAELKNSFSFIILHFDFCTAFILSILSIPVNFVLRLTT